MRTQTLAVMLLAFGLVTGIGKAQRPLLSSVSISYALTPTPHITVTNNNRSRLTGMVVTVFNTVPPYRRAEVIWFDSGVNFRHDTPPRSRIKPRLRRRTG